MRKIALFSIFIIISLHLFSVEYYSLLDKSKKIVIQTGKNTYYLGFKNLINNSEIITFNNNQLERDKDYKILYGKGEITFLKNFQNESILKTQFKIIPKNLLLSYKKYKKIKDFSQKKYKKINIIPSKQDGISSSALNISGSKSFAVSVGNKEDLSLNQSLFLQIDGELSRRIFVKAQLSDNNSPIAPEGTTKKLSEIDKIFIKVYSSDYSLLFGDFFINNRNTQFSNYDFKLEGVKFNWEKIYNINGAAAVSNGDFMSYSFYGKEGIQGPYYLPGKNSSRTKILSGSEKIYLEGKKQERGVDYTINYNEGSITFKNKNIITEESYIITDYEYSSEEFQSNLYMGSGRLSFFDRNVDVFFSVITNNDDKNNPLNYNFTEEDIEILKQAGDDPEKARINGADSVGVGNGDYIKIDSHFEYVGYDSTGNYNVSFSYAGEGKGSYEQSGYNQYEWVGENNGSYIPEIQLPLPQKRMNFDIGTKLNLGKFTLYSEGMYTIYDKNSFSKLDDKNNNGFAIYNNINFKTDIGDYCKSNYSAYYKYKDKNFHSLAKVESSQEEYETINFYETDTVNVIKYGGETNFSLFQYINNHSQFYFKNMKTVAKQNKLSNAFSYKQNESLIFLPSLDYYYNIIKEERTLSDSNIYRLDQKIHDLKGNYQFYFLDLEAGYYEKKFKNKKEQPFGILIKKDFYKTKFNLFDTNIILKYQRENQDSLQSTWYKYRKSQLWMGKILYNNENFTFSSNYSHRENKYYVDRDNSKFDLLNTQISLNLLGRSVYNKFNYKIGNTEITAKVKQLIYVGEGNGSYTIVDSVVVYEGPGEGDYEYKITSIGDAKPISEVEMNWNLNLNPARCSKNISFFSGSFWEKITFSSDIAIQEKSDTPHKLDLYLLRPSALFNEQHTDYGFQRIKEQIWYNIKKNQIVTRFVYEKTKKMDNRYENEFDKLWEDDYRIYLNLYNFSHWNLENEISYQKKTSNYQTENFLKTKSLGFDTDIAYKFNLNTMFSTTLGYEIEDGEKTDGTESYKIQSYIIEPEIVYNLGQKYHFLAKIYLQNNKREGSDYLANILFSKRNGLSTRLNLQFDYKFSKYVTGFLRFYTEKYPEVTTRYQFKIEVRADF